MSTLLAAGAAMMSGSQGRSGLFPAGGATFNPATLGIRSLREEYLRPGHRSSIPRNLKLIEERITPEMQQLDPVATEERQQLPRFHYLFQGGELLPATVFVEALALAPHETLNGRHMPFDPEVLVLRDSLVAAYKPVVACLRKVFSKEAEDVPPRVVQSFARAWTSWERVWLRNREVHAVDALQPLAKAILALEPLLLSHEKERLLPFPRVQHQKVVTLKCLEGFVHALNDLAAAVLPSLQRELDHDTRLLLLMDHVLQMSGDSSVESCISGLSTTPDVAFPDHEGASVGGIAKSSKGLPLDSYAFRLLGSSVGDAKAAARQRALLEESQGMGQTQNSLGGSSTGSAAGTGKPSGTSGSGGAAAAAVTALAGKETQLARKAQVHAIELLSAFEAVKDVLLSLKSTLEFIDPALDKDEAFVEHLRRFERAFRRARRLFLEPDNLA